ncbi:MAG: DedA family protein [Patescibacteria group bacterium]|nr:DedA family protein [Patescibacteria group bacterium]MDE2116380.1 DedA family protein [Patescibacteria group bacterium]
MLEVILAQYGLIAVFVGTFIEGEIVVIAAGVLASLAFLSLWWVLVVAFVATFLGDQFFFFLGRKKGTAFLEKRHRVHWRRRAEKVHDLIHNHQNKILFGYRFLYGLRVPTLFAIGTSELPTRKFVLINLANSAIWTALFVFGGYFFGDVFISFVVDARAYAGEMILGILIIALIVWAISIWRNREEYN